MLTLCPVNNYPLGCPQDATLCETCPETTQSLLFYKCWKGLSPGLYSQLHLALCFAQNWHKRKVFWISLFKTLCLSCSVNSVILQQHPEKAVWLTEKQLSQCFPARAWQHSMVHRCTKCKAEIKRPDKEPDSPNFKSWLFHFLTQWIWESRLSSLNFIFLIGKLR